MSAWRPRIIKVASGKLLATFKKLGDLGTRSQAVGNTVLQAVAATAATGIEEAGTGASRVDQVLTRSIFLLFVGMLLGAMLSLGLSLYITRSITRPLAGYIDNLKESAEKVTAASDQLSAESQSMAEGAASRPRPWRKPPPRWKRWLPCPGKTDDNASHANVLSGEAVKILDNSGTTIENLMSAMQGVSQASRSYLKNPQIH